MNNRHDPCSFQGLQSGSKRQVGNKSHCGLLFYFFKVGSLNKGKLDVLWKLGGAEESGGCNLAQGGLGPAFFEPCPTHKQPLR